MTLACTPASGRLDGRAVGRLTATADLDGLSLDLRGLTVPSVLLDGRRARFTQLPVDELGRRRAGGA